MHLQCTMPAPGPFWQQLAVDSHKRKMSGSACHTALLPGPGTWIVGLVCRSTLVALLQRLYDPTRGQVLVDGMDLHSLDAGWCALLGLTPL